jgi:ElaB/YqjD/DUF883 family membrane-anchored ribosome-binding protein
MNPEESRAAEIESDIRRTRNRMGDDIEAIGDKLSPSRIKQRAKEAVSRKTREAGAGLIRAARENPIPATMVAVGLTWLFRTRGKHQSWQDPDFDVDDGAHSSVKEKAQELAHSAGEKVQHVSQQASQKARRAGYTLQYFFEDNPLIAGAGVIALGAAIGALLPHTKKEDRLMGSARDELVQQAQGVAEHAKVALEERLSEPSSEHSQEPPIPSQGDRYAQQWQR